MWNEGMHIITLTHLRDEQVQFVCKCGESFLGPMRVAKTLIVAHRMEKFPTVRETLMNDEVAYVHLLG